MWQIPFLFVNSVNSVLVNGVPLSDTKTSGMPCVAKRVRKWSIVFQEVAELTTWTSIHLE